MSDHDAERSLPAREPRRHAAVIFGRELRDRRSALGWSQEALAERAGVHAKYISMLERGVRQPTLETLLRLGRAMGERPGALVNTVDASWVPEP
ncbi:MAG: helix-turn-helix transcriptional regulator [Bacteroidota bacterium]